MILINDCSWLVSLGYGFSLSILYWLTDELLCLMGSSSLSLIALIVLSLLSKTKCFSLYLSLTPSTPTLDAFLLTSWLMVKCGFVDSLGWSIVARCCNLSLSELEVGTNFLNLFFLYLSAFIFTFQIINHKGSRSISISWMAGSCRCCTAILSNFGAHSRSALLLILIFVFCHLACWFVTGNLVYFCRRWFFGGCSTIALSCP